MIEVAALYVDPRGPYPAMPDVDAWDEARDARKYAGPHPIVAHPPCGPWGSLRKWSTQDRGLALLAVRQLVRFGGVLEHPRGSALWKALDLPRPGEIDFYDGDSDLWCAEVEQVRWGHVARKRTWLLFSRIPQFRVIQPPAREPTHWCSGRATPGGRGYAQGKKIASAQQRRRTPPKFARWLVTLAQHARR